MYAQQRVILLQLTNISTDLNILLSQDANFRLFYDFDDTGLSKTKQKIKQGFSVFLWLKFFKYWASKKKNPNKAYRKLIANIKDLNQVGKIEKNPYKSLDLEKFFSYDEFDLLYIEDSF